MLNKEEGAAAANEQRPDTEVSDTNYYNSISELIGQFFKSCSVINQKSEANVYSTYLDGKVSCIIIIRGRQFEILPESDAGISVLTRSLTVMELLEEMLCKKS